MSLGLDLRGGVYFLYQVDVEARSQQLLVATSRTSAPLLRDERIPFTGRVAANGSRSSRGHRACAAATMSDRGGARCDPQAGSEPCRRHERRAATARIVTVDARRPSRSSERQDFAIQQNITTLRNRVNELGVAEPIVQRQGLDRIVVQLPGVQNPTR